MGTVLSIFRTSLPNENPSFLGIMTSKIHRSYLSLRKAIRASSPSWARVTSNFPFSSKQSFRSSPKLGSSSASNIFCICLLVFMLHDPVQLLLTGKLTQRLCLCLFHFSPGFYRSVVLRYH